MPKNAIPRPGQGKRGVDGHIGYLLRQAHGASRLQMERALAEHGVTPPQFAVLTMLNAYAGASNADIARLSLLTPQTVNVIVANLERAGLVERTPHQQHGRIRQIALTAAGRALLGTCRRRVQAVEQWLLDGLDANEEAVVRRWLAGVAARPPLR
jgi:DNA-binding MarR family transcriptional regulator